MDGNNQNSLPQFNVHYTWIYLTERCNLQCEYCFYRHRSGGRGISQEAVERLFCLFDRHQTYPLTLIFSGGEAFLVKNRMFQIMSEARRRLQKTSLHVQTNGLLIDKSDIKTLLDLHVSLEFGIDGLFEQTQRHRWGLKATSFSRLIDNIQRCLQSGVSCGCTMTVHPSEVEYMEDGLRFLQSIGLHQVDITPAAFEPWTPPKVEDFKRAYLSIIRQKDLRRLLYTQEDIKKVRFGWLDLSLHPPGYLLGGDPFLCLPEEKRKEFSLWNEKTGLLKKDMYNYYKEGLRDIWREEERLSYREQVCRNFELVNRMMGKAYINTWAINDMLRYQCRVHQKLWSYMSVSENTGHA